MAKQFPPESQDHLPSSLTGTRSEMGGTAASGGGVSVLCPRAPVMSRPSSLPLAAVWQARLSKQNSGNHPYIFHFLVEACVPHAFTARLPSPWPPRTPYLAPMKWRWHSICYLTLSSRRVKPCVFLQPDIIDCSLQCKRKMMFSNKYLFRQRYREKRLSLSNEGTIRKQETKMKR